MGIYFNETTCSSVAKMPDSIWDEYEKIEVNHSMVEEKLRQILVNISSNRIFLGSK
jgi:hypothetical protein